MSGKKIEAKELRCQKRQALQDVIPLEMPYVVYVEPTNACNFKCRFCPTSDPALLKRVGRQQGFMPFDLYEKIIGDIKAFGGRLRLLSLYKDGEPLLHPRFADMVRLAKEAGVADRIWTKTNGALLNPELNRKIVEAGIDHVCVSIESTTAEGYRDISGVAIDLDRLRANIEDLYRNRNNCEVYIKIVDVGLTEEQKQAFYARYQDICTHIGIEKLMGWSNSGVKDFTLGTQPDTYDGLPFTEKDICPYPFYVMAVNCNGTVSLCGNDWSHQTVVGDARSRSLHEIWNGRELFDFRMMMLTGKRHLNKACGECYYLKIVPDNLDPHRQLIIEQLAAARRG